MVLSEDDVGDSTSPASRAGSIIAASVYLWVSEAMAGIAAVVVCAVSSRKASGKRQNLVVPRSTLEPTHPCVST